MPEINYCQNLWNQFEKVDQAHKECVITLDQILGGGKKRNRDLETAISVYEDELHKMDEVWENSFMVLPDGRKVLAPDGEVLNILAGELGVELERWLTSSREIVISKHRRVTSISIGSAWHIKPLNDISALTRLSELEHLYISSKTLGDLSSLEKLTKLTALAVGCPEVHDLTFIGRMTKLNWLDFNSQHAFSNLSILDKLINLESLYLAGTQVTDLSPLENLANINTLGLSNTNITDISPLAMLRNLKILFLDECTRIEDFSVLKKLKKLEYLHLHKIPQLQGEEQNEFIKSLRVRYVFN